MRNRSKKSIKKKLHKRRYDGHYNENDVKKLFFAISRNDISWVRDILDSDKTLIRTSYKLTFKSTEIELLPKSYAQLLEHDGNC